ncbi:hypothetical protein B0H10DRAFT_2014028 [Mycena sp. CBHHK59/15]|nr:hypothetical protein B0H10DRAFT_2014028 [Mycena sp. CBHHK59/15]
MGPIPLRLPPLREINHQINLIDEEALYNYHMPRCPDALRPQLREKINCYVRAGAGCDGSVNTRVPAHGNGAK